MQRIDRSRFGEVQRSWQPLTRTVRHPYRLLGIRTDQWSTVINGYVFMEDHDFEDFKLKLEYLKDQYQRLLTRFNYFLTVEVALFGFFGWLIFDKNNIIATRLPALIGVLVSFLWYIVAAEDRELAKQYRERADRSAKRVGDKFASDHPAKGARQCWTSILSWYCRPLSVTRIPVYCALISLVIWLGVLIFGTSFLGAFLPNPLLQPTP